jgi:hypothetical protein
LGLAEITQKIDYVHMYNNIKQFTIYEIGENWTNELGPRFSPHNWFFRDIQKHIVPPQYQDKKIAIIWGIDKPNLKLIDGKQSFQFTDTAVFTHGTFSQVNTFNVTNINFYWDPAYPLILLKQLHTIKERKKDIVSSIYNFKKPLSFKSGKSPTLLIGKNDMFILKDLKTEIFDFYFMGMQKLKSYIGHTKLTSTRSKPYAIE